MQKYVWWLTDRTGVVQARRNCVGAQEGSRVRSRARHGRRHDSSTGRAPRRCRASRTPPDSEWQKEFEAAFPYQETPRPAIGHHRSEIGLAKGQADGSAHLRPMSATAKPKLRFAPHSRRSIAASRSRFSLPTTVLAEQHYRTFSQLGSPNTPFTGRCGEPLQGRGRNRKRTLKNLASGGIDVDRRHAPGSSRKT